MTDIQTTYVPKITKLLEEVRAEALSRGMECEGVNDMSDDGVRLAVLVRSEGGSDEDGVDVSITVPESEDYDGVEDGCNFSLDIVSYGGVVMGGFTPYNFTDACWVRRGDPVAVEERWQVFAHHFDASAVVDRIQERFDNMPRE